MKAEVNMKKVDEYLATVGEHIAGSIEAVKGTVIEDHDDYKAACDCLFEAKLFEDQVAEEKSRVLAEAKALVEAVEGKFRTQEGAIGEHIELLKKMVREYAIDREGMRKAQLAKAAALAKKDPKKARELQAGADDWLAPKVKGISFVSKLKVEVTNAKKLAKKFFIEVIDKAGLQSAAEEAFAAEEEIEGVAITDARTVRVTPSQREMS